MWQQAFHRKILDDRARVYPDNSFKEEAKEEEEKIKKESEIKNKIEENLSESNKNREGNEKGGKIKEKDEHNKEKSLDNKYRKERQRSRSPKNVKKLSDSETEKKGNKFLSGPSHSLDDGINEEIRRMEKIRQILQRRNDENALAEARLRYFERREHGEILPPY